MKKSCLAVSILLLTAACSTAPAQDLSIPDYSQQGRINIDVKDLSFVDHGVDERQAAPIISDQFQPTIAEAVHNWASQRLQAVGSAGQGAVVVKNAYVTTQLIPSNDSWFDRPQASKYIGHVEVEIAARGTEGSALATANATRTVSLPEDPSEKEKSEAYGALLDGLMNDLNKNLETAIHDHLTDFIITAPVIGGKLPPVPESPNQGF